jgi:hypothetical protein
VSVLSYKCYVTVIAMAVLISKRQICLSAFLSRTSLSLQHLLHSCQRRHVRRAKRTVDFCVDNKKGPFGNRLLVKLRVGKENKEGREDATFQNLKESIFFLMTVPPDRQPFFLIIHNCLKHFSILRGIFSSLLTPQTKPLLV